MNRKIMFLKSVRRCARHGGVFVLMVTIALHLMLSDGRASDLMIPLEVPEINFVGVVAGAYPAYPGSNNPAFGMAPVGRIVICGERSVTLLASDIRLNVIDSPNWNLGPEFFYRFGRSRVDDEVVERVHEVGDSAELGLFGGYTWKDRQDLRKQFGIGGWGLLDVSGRHNGWTAGINAFGMYPVFRPVTIAAGLGATYAGNNYTDAYFGVTASDSLASGLMPYEAKGGVRDARGWMALMLHLSLNWHTGIGVMYSRLLGDGARSPIVAERGTKDQWVYGFGVVYGW